MEKRSREDGATVGEKIYADFEPAPAPTMGPGGVVQVGFVGPAAAAPDFTEENVICLRGPCRHFWHLVTTVGEGNPEGTWESLGMPQPRQHSYTCLRNPGMETEFADDAAFDCNLWDPLTDGEVADRDARRQLYQIRRAREAPVERIEDVVDDGERIREEDAVEITQALAASENQARAWFFLGRGPRSFEEVWAEAQAEKEKGS